MKKTIQGTQSFGRAINLLQKIADLKTAPTIADLIVETDLTRPSLYRMLGGLEAEGLIIQTVDKRYILGLRLVILARKALAQNDIRPLVRSALEDLRDKTGETVHLAVRSGDELVYIDKIESMETVRMTSTIGTRVPFHSSGVGKAFLAALTEEESDALISSLSLTQITPFTTVTHSVLRNQVSDARAQGYVFDNQENETGIVCYGAAIRDVSDTPIASISISVPLFRHSDVPSYYSAPLLRCVESLSHQLGGSL